VFVFIVNRCTLAVGRIFIAILENCQNSDHSIRIPSVLVPYMDGIKEISKNGGKLTAVIINVKDISYQ
jgi:seryl-tRNA synthetase